MSLKELLDQNASQTAETQEELERVERVLGTARLSSTATAQDKQKLEDGAAALRTRLENLASQRLHFRRRAAEKFLFPKADLDIARKRLTELIEDIRRYSVHPCSSAAFRDETDRMLRELVIRRADIARDLGLRTKRKAIDAELRWIIDDMVEARLLGTTGEAGRDPRVIARVIADVFKDLGLLRSDADTGRVREILWAILKEIIVTAAGSAARAFGGGAVACRVDAKAEYEAAWIKNRESVDVATSLFAEPVDAKSLFGLLFGLSCVRK